MSKGVKDMDDLIDRKRLDEAFTMLRFDEHGNVAHWDDRKNWCLHGHEIEKLIASQPSVDVVKVVRCENCVNWEAPPENEQMDGNTTGFCRYKYGACYGQETDMTWFCADGERVSE